MRRFILLQLTAILAVCQVSADGPFRQHRYDQFKALPPQDSTIVFLGNSITNMYEWWEAFGSEQRVVNRGTSGAFTWELIDNVGTVISLRPAKVFIEIGTNDLGSRHQPDSVAARVGRLVSLIREGSPDTQIYVNSILPSKIGSRTLEAIQAANSMIKELVESQGATYIDLYDDMPGITTNEISYDGLHLTSKGYAKWLGRLAPFVGLNPVYKPGMEENNGGMPHGSSGMRNTYFSAYPLRGTDIVMMGDEMIHGGEWHELLGNPRVKNRGTGWGYGGISLDAWRNSVPAIFATNGNKQAPAKILIYAGVEPLYFHKVDLSDILDDYKALIAEIRKYARASDTRIEIMSLIPRNSRELNDTLTVPFNRLLQTLASDTDNIGFIDIYTPLAREDNSAGPRYVENDYLTGQGYGIVARIIAPYIPGSVTRDPGFE